jgi:hypothetical protein
MVGWCQGPDTLKGSGPCYGQLIRSGCEDMPAGEAGTCTMLRVTATRSVALSRARGRDGASWVSVTLGSHMSRVEDSDATRSEQGRRLAV